MISTPSGDEAVAGSAANSARHLAPGIDRFGIPGGLGQEELQPLHLSRLRLDKRLGAD